MTETETATTIIPSAYAVAEGIEKEAANCERADDDPNDQGNIKGNARQCGLLGGSNEQSRSCQSPNESKDTDEDTFFRCIDRGHKSRA
jgi:hypothetical protein